MNITEISYKITDTVIDPSNSKNVCWPGVELRATIDESTEDFENCKDVLRSKLKNLLVEFSNECLARYRK